MPEREMHASQSLVGLLRLCHTMPGDYSCWLDEAYNSQYQSMACYVASSDLIKFEDKPLKPH